MKNWALQKQTTTGQSLSGTLFSLREIKVPTVDWYEGHQTKCCNLKVTLTAAMPGGESLELTQDSPFPEACHRGCGWGNEYVKIL